MQFLLNLGTRGGGEGLAVCLQGIRRMLWAERTPASDGLHTGAGPRVMDGCGQGCLQAVCESFTILSCFHPKPALCITQESAPIALPDRETQAGGEGRGQSWGNPSFSPKTGQSHGRHLAGPSSHLMQAISTGHWSVAENPIPSLPLSQK